MKMFSCWVATKLIGMRTQFSHKGFPFWASVLLVCLPMSYQWWLLWDQYQNDVSPLIYYRLELYSDLPAATVCVPSQYTIPKSLVERHAERSTDPRNACWN